jgi:GPI mannosyltransferase 3
MTISLVLHLIAAVFSEGYYHWDEHFQIYEFLGFKLGMTPVSALPIEFAEKIRPWMQVWILWLVTKVLGWVNITDPFNWAFVFRLISSLIGWYSVLILTRSTKFFIKNPAWQKVAIISLALFWYLPALHARVSSENWGASFFWIALGLYFLSAKKTVPYLLKIGFLLGLAFEFRYQMGVMIGGFWLWLLFLNRKTTHKPLKQIATMSIGLLVAMLLGVWVNYWGYGDWTFSPWNYVRFNLIEGKVNVIDVFPWWDFFRRAFTEAWPVLGGVLFLLFPVAWFRNPKSVLTWTNLPFFLVHCAIGHKELRFIFPIAAVGPLLFVQAIQPFWNRILLNIVVLFNLVALLGTTLVPAWVPVWFYKHMYRHTPPSLYYLQDEPPYKVIGIPVHYYRPPGLKLIPIKKYSDLGTLIHNEEQIWVFHNRFFYKNDEEILKGNCTIEYSMLPQVLWKLEWTGLLQRMTNWKLLRCEGKKRG